VVQRASGKVLQQGESEKDADVITHLKGMNRRSSRKTKRGVGPVKPGSQVKSKAAPANRRKWTTGQKKVGGTFLFSAKIPAKIINFVAPQQRPQERKL
jgi:hypothetical protein